MTGRIRVQITPSYFGKIPARADFIESAHADYPLIRHVDRWMAECIQTGSPHMEWAGAYDRGARVDFLAASTSSRSIACGSILPSRDSCGRRFPLIGMLRTDARVPLDFAVVAPLAFNQAWRTIGRRLDQLMGTRPHEPAWVPAGWPCTVMTTYRWLAALSEDYTTTETLPALDAAFAACGHRATVPAAVTLLANLMAPIHHQPHKAITRGLIMPFPEDALRQPRVMAFWLDLVLAALGKRDIEVIALRTHEPVPRLIISFDGTRGSELLAAWLPDAVADRYIDLTAAAPQHDGDPAIPSSLAALRKTFLKTITEPRACAI